MLPWKQSPADGFQATKVPCISHYQIRWQKKSNESVKCHPSRNRSAFSLLQRLPPRVLVCSPSLFNLCLNLLVLSTLTRELNHSPWRAQEHFISRLLGWNIFCRILSVSRSHDTSSARLTMLTGFDDFTCLGTDKLPFFPWLVAGYALLPSNIFFVPLSDFREIGLQKPLITRNTFHLRAFFIASTLRVRDILEANGTRKTIPLGFITWLCAGVGIQARNGFLTISERLQCLGHGLIRPCGLRRCWPWCYNRLKISQLRSDKQS